MLATITIVYWNVLVELVDAWSTDDNYSHGFFIAPLAIYFAWERRRALAALPVQPSWLGVFVIAASLMLFIAGSLGAELFLSRVSLIGVLAGAVLFLFGWRHFKALLFPLAFLLLMIPLPALIFNQIAFPLQLFASEFGAAVIEASNVPVLREGNIITLAGSRLEVAEACSGIRSLISLLTLGIVYGYFTDHRLWLRWVVALATVPIAIVANGLRVAGTGVLAHYYGAEAAEGFFHTFSGWIVFIVAFAMLFVVTWALRRLFPEPVPRVSAEGAAA